MKVLFLSRKQLVKIKITSAVVCLLLIVTMIQLSKNSAVISTTGYSSYPSIVIDAGHGGFDPGATGADGTREDEICLNIAKALEIQLKNNGYDVIMTRTNANAVGPTKSKDMEIRKNIIKNSHATLVVSIHLNAYRDANYYGSQTYYYKDSNQSKQLAEAIQKQVKTVVSESNRSQDCVPNDSFLLLKASEAPTVLIECGFLSNINEREKLKTTTYQQDLAEAIFEGINLYLNKEAA